MSDNEKKQTKPPPPPPPNKDKTVDYQGETIKKKGANDG
jgi:hypothetical protein